MFTLFGVLVMWLISARVSSCSLDVSGARGDETALGYIVNQTVK